jgi:hypothetical protein
MLGIIDQNGVPLTVERSDTNPLAPTAPSQPATSTPLHNIRIASMLSI